MRGLDPSIHAPVLLPTGCIVCRAEPGNGETGEPASIALLEKATMSDGHIEQTNFDSYTPMRMKDMPEIDVSIISNGEAPVGCGEPAVTVVAPAIGNAIFNAVGARVRALPITAEAVKGAMKA